LCLAQPRFQLFPFCNVFGEDIQIQDRSRQIADRPAAHAHLDLLPIAAEPRAFDSLGGVPAQQSLAKRIETFGSGENERQVSNQQVSLGARIVSQHLQHGAVDLEELPALRGAANGIRGFFDQGPVALLGEPHRSLRQQPLGGIQSHTDHPHHLAILSPQGFHVGLQFAPAHVHIEGAPGSLQSPAVCMRSLLAELRAVEESVDGFPGIVLGANIGGPQPCAR